MTALLIDRPKTGESVSGPIRIERVEIALSYRNGK